MIDGALRPIERIERVALAGRATAASWPETSSSTADVPPFARAAMDGYAVRAAGHVGRQPRDSRATLTLDREGVHRPDAGAAVGPGECTEIATGAPMPEGADAVVMVEETDGDDGSHVRIFAPRRAARRTSAGRARTSRTGQTCSAAGDDAQRRAASARLRPSA